MRVFGVIAVAFFLAAPIAAQAQGVPRGMNYGLTAVLIPVTACSDRSVALLVGLLAERLAGWLAASTACSELILILVGITTATGANQRFPRADFTNRLDPRKCQSPGIPARETGRRSVTDRARRLRLRGRRW